MIYAMFLFIAVIFWIFVCLFLLKGFFSFVGDLLRLIIWILTIPYRIVVKCTASRHYIQAVAWYRQYAEQGDANAQNRLGVHYADGLGVPQDYAQAVRWFRKAADQGDAQAQSNLGALYCKGHGVPLNYSEAFVWYRKAADQGDSDIQFMLGMEYYIGFKVPQDYMEAYFWTDIAASGKPGTSKREEIVKYRDIVASHLAPADIIRVQERARKWFEDHPAKP